MPTYIKKINRLLAEYQSHQSADILFFLKNILLTAWQKNENIDKLEWKQFFKASIDILLPYNIRNKFYKSVVFYDAVDSQNNYLIFRKWVDSFATDLAQHPQVEAVIGIGYPYYDNINISRGNIDITRRMWLSIIDYATRSGRYANYQGDIDSLLLKFTAPDIDLGIIFVDPSFTFKLSDLIKEKPWPENPFRKRFLNWPKRKDLEKMVLSKGQSKPFLHKWTIGMVHSLNRPGEFEAMAQSYFKKDAFVIDMFNTVLPIHAWYLLPFFCKEEDMPNYFTSSLRDMLFGVALFTKKNKHHLEGFSISEKTQFNFILNWLINHSLSLDEIVDKVVALFEGNNAGHASLANIYLEIREILINIYQVRLQYLITHKYVKQIKSKYKITDIGTKYIKNILRIRDLLIKNDEINIQMPLLFHHAFIDNKPNECRI